MKRSECIENRRPGGQRRRCGIWPVLLLAAAGLGLYWHTLPAPFIFDDAAAIVNNASIREVSPAVLAAPRDTPTAGRPVVNATLAFNYALGGLDVTGFHALNIAIHICCALVLYGIVRRTLLGGTAERALASSPVVRRPTTGDVAIAPSAVPRHHLVALSASLLWLVHPLQTECVSYVTQRTESIMALFFLLTLYAAIRARGSDRSRWWSAAAIVACGLGMASKESMVTAPLLVVLYDWAYRDGPWRQVLARRRGLYAGLAATWVVLLALSVTGPRSETVGFGLGVTAWQYGLNQCVVVVEYLGRVVWPDGLLLDYGFPRSLGVAEAAPWALALLGLIGLTAVLLLRRPRLGYPAAWFFVVLAPTSSVVPIATEVAADRRVYLALAGLTVLAAVAGFAMIEAARQHLGGHLQRGGRLAGVTSLIMLIMLIVAATSLSTVSWRRAAMYREPVTLWEQAVDAHPRNHRALTNLAVALAAEGRYTEATVHMLRAAAVDPGSTITADNVAALLAAGAGRNR